MRKCNRCQSDMVESCHFRVEGGAYGIVIVTGRNKLFGRKIGTPKVAICPKCGEVSIYIENIKSLLP